MSKEKKGGYIPPTNGIAIDRLTGYPFGYNENGVLRSEARANELRETQNVCTEASMFRGLEAILSAIKQEQPANSREIELQEALVSRLEQLTEFILFF